MTNNYSSRFARCGYNVVVEPGAHIEHPELFSVGDHVRIGRGFHSQGASRVTLGSHVTMYPYCFIQGIGELMVSDYVDFFRNTYISTGDANGRTRVGRQTHFAVGCALYGKLGLTVGDFCNIAAHVVLSTVQHDPRIHPEPMAEAPASGGPITLADDIWIGANSTVTPNTTIARGCIIAAGAVLTRDTAPFGIYRGVPARRLRDREPASDQVAGTHSLEAG